jgi:hypothetical protein
LTLEAQPEHKGRWWEDVDRLFAGLPAPLFRQVKLLEYDLALRYSTTGQFHDVFDGPEFPPVLSVAPWILDDLEAPAGPTRDGTERVLFLASALLAMRAQTVQALRDPAGFTTEDRIALVQWLSERATAEIGRVVPHDSQYWEAHAEIATEDAVRLAVWGEPERVADLEDDPESSLASALAAPLKLVALAALAVVDRLEGGQRIGDLLENVANAYQVIADLASMARDLEVGHLSYPIRFIARAAGLSLRPAPMPEIIMGAMVATGSVTPIVGSALDRLRSARKSAAALRLPTLAAFLAEAETHFEERPAGVTVGLPGGGPARPPPASGQLASTLSQALSMAEGFLVGDPTFRESWETHREGMLGQPVVASRFPTGLVLDVLCRRGLDVSAAIDDFLQFTVANGFRYYDHPGSGIDSDTIGVFLRLRSHATPDAGRDRSAAAVLECLARNVHDAGRIPVWISGCAGMEGAEEPRSAVIALGEDCGTVAAHLLLGLVATGDDHQETVAIGAPALLDRIGRVGLAANVNYPPLYALGVFFRLMDVLDGASSAQLPMGGLGDARAALTRELERAVAPRPRSAQDATLLILACHDAHREDLIDPGWLAGILRRQRFDGSWIGEPFAAAPNRGRSVSWYSSTLLTTALCYDALAREANRFTAATH